MFSNPFLKAPAKISIISDIKDAAALQIVTEWLQNYSRKYYLPGGGPIGPPLRPPDILL